MIIGPIRRAATVAVVALAAAACGGTGEPAAATSEAGDALVVYSGRDEALIGELVEAFTTETGIEVAVKYGDTSELAATLLEEGTASPADVYWAQDAGALGAIEDAGLFAALPAMLLDEVEDRYASADGRWVGTSARVRVIGHSTTRVETADVPRAIDDVTRPAWKGRVGWAPTNGSFQAFVTAMRLERGDVATREWLEAMIANEAVAYPKNSAIVLAIDAGEVDLGLINHYYPLQIGADDPGLEVASIVPDGIGGLANVAGAGVLASSDAASDAEAFVSYLLSDAAQRYFVERTFEYPLIDGVEADSRLTPLESLPAPAISIGDLTDLEGTLELLAGVGLL